MNTPGMSHVGNWSARKLALERSRAAARARLETPAPEVRVHLWGRHFNLLAMHPCDTTRLDLEAKATCHRCRRVEAVPLAKLLRTRHAHTPWPEVMEVLRCGACKGPPAEIVFYAKGMANPETAYRGRLSIHPPPPEEAQVGWSEPCDPRVRRSGP